MSIILLLHSTDLKMVSQSLMPLSSNQHSAMTWLETYANDFGDHIPNENLIYLSMPTKRSVWRDYVYQMNEFGVPYLQESMFMALWNSIYPNFLIRPWVNVAGKCNTCYYIDAIRRQSKNPALLEAAKQAHQLHRGGLFIIEREA